MKYNKCITWLIILMSVIFLQHHRDYDWQLHQTDSGPSISGKMIVSNQRYDFRNKTWSEKLDWKTRELERLGNLVQSRIFYLQNPMNCDATKKILCKYDQREIGFGSKMHDGINCLIAAYATQRTLIIESVGWVYAERGLDSMFLPLSINCTSTKNQTATLSVDLNNIENIKNVQMPRNAHIKIRPTYLPLSIPDDLADNLRRIHKNPSGWWIGQFLVYLIRKSQDLKHFIENRKESFRFHHPIAGIHVRRTDKQSEARYHDLTEYMIQVDKWFNSYKKYHRPVQRQVYFASDEPGVLKQAVKRYPEYTFLSNMNASVIAKSKKTRYSESSLRELIFDIEMLSKCDFVVCTLTSSNSAGCPPWNLKEMFLYTPSNKTAATMTDTSQVENAVLNNISTADMMHYHKRNITNTVLNSPVTANTSSHLKGFHFVQWKCCCYYNAEVGRLVYELMHVRYWDAPTRIKSLDVEYTFHHQFLKTTSALENYRKNVNPRSLTVYRNVTNDHQVSMISLDNEKIRVKMPTYPFVLQ